MKILILSDIHFGQDAIYKNMTNPDGPEYVSCFGSQFPQLFSKLKTEVDFQSIDLLVNLGDSIADVDHSSDIENFQKISDVLRSAGSRAVFVLGNHDLKRVSFGEIKDIIEMPNPYYSFDLGNFHHVVLYAERKRPTDKDCPYTMGAEQLLWLKDDLEKSSLPVLIYSHYPFVYNKLEGNRYFSGHPERVFPVESKEIKDIIRDSGKVRAVFSGHVHFGDVEKEMVDGVKHITAVSFSENDGSGKPFAQYLIVDTSSNNISIEEKKLM